MSFNRSSKVAKWRPNFLAMGKSLLEETFRTIKFRRAIMSRMSTKDLQRDWNRAQDFLNALNNNYFV